MSIRLKGITLAITAATLWGVMGIFVRGLNASGYSTYDISFLRCFFAGIIFLILKIIKTPSILKIDIKGLLICLLYGISSIGISFVSYGISVERIPVAVATVLMFMSPIWVAIFGIILFKEKIQMKTTVSIIICIIGAILVSNLVGTSGIHMDMIGVLAGVINSIGVALQITIPKYFSTKYERDTMLLYGFLSSSLLLVFLTDFSLIKASLYSAEIGSILFNIFGVAILCTMVANVSFVKSAQYINATTSSILAALEVVIGAAVGYLIFHEHLTTLQITGALIIVVGSLGSPILEFLFNKKKEYQIQQ